MVALDNLVVTTALPVIKRDLGATLADLQWMVNAYTLTFAVLLITGAALGDRFGRQARLPHRDGHLHRRFGAGGPVAVDRHPHPRPGHPGRRWRHRHAADPDHPVGRGPAGASRGRAGRLGWHRRSGDRHRAARRWRDRRGPRLALDLLAQRADRPHRHAAGRDSPDRDLRPRGSARHPGSGPHQRRPARPRVGRHQRQRPRLGQPAGRRGDRGRGRPARRLRRLGGPPGPPDAAAAASSATARSAPPTPSRC